MLPVREILKSVFRILENPNREFMKKSDKSNRSQAYQHLYTEVSVSQEYMSSFLDPGSQSHTEEYYELRTLLIDRLFLLLRASLTANQLKIIQLVILDGYTQIEAAKLLGINQSSITKSMNGNCDYRNGKKKVYGGSLNKLRRLASKDPEIQDLLKKIQEEGSNETNE